MVYINLLPIREIKRRTKAVQQLSLYTFVLIGVLVAIGAVAFYQVSTAKQLKQNIAALNKEKQHYNQILAQIKKLEADKKEIESRIAVINELKKSSALTVHMLDEIANLTPTKRIWLSSLKQSGTSLLLAGMALDNQTVANYMEALKTSPYITEINLNTSTQKVFAGADLMSFTLNCTISMPGNVASGEEAASETKQEDKG